MDDQNLEEQLADLRDLVFIRRLELATVGLGSKQSGLSWDSEDDVLELINSARDLLGAGLLTAPAAYRMAERRLDAAHELTEMQRDRVSEAERRDQEAPKANGGSDHTVTATPDAEPGMSYNPYSRQFAQNEADYQWAKTHGQIADEGWG
ncbi:hypothetical protein [Streptomyces sp. NPDC057909]|uniref:hypothetical protein n=1 Tax=Streptomyces sp. NPDC057909 TaxID=3346277 RepID=UPI0036E7AECD